MKIHKMRELKLRAWHKDIGYICRVMDVDFNEDGSVDEVCIKLEDDVANSYCATDLTLLQYTGMKDVNGVEIYEGDLCKVIYVDGEDIKPVEFDKGTYYIGHVSLGMNFCRAEVIGNIYENKELW